MTRKLFIAGIILIVIGNIGRIYANSFTYVDANGVLRDTAWMPISALLLLAGIAILLIASVLYGINLLRNR